MDDLGFDLRTLSELPDLEGLGTGALVYLPLYEDEIPYVKLAMLDEIELYSAGPAEASEDENDRIQGIRILARLLYRLNRSMKQH